MLSDMLHDFACFIQIACKDEGSTPERWACFKPYGFGNNTPRVIHSRIDTSWTNLYFCLMIMFFGLLLDSILFYYIYCYLVSLVVNKVPVQETLVFCYGKIFSRRNVFLHAPRELLLCFFFLFLLLTAIQQRLGKTRARCFNQHNCFIANWDCRKKPQDFPSGKWDWEIE